MIDYDKSIHSNPDAQAWAKFFMATVKEKEWCIDDIDEGLMLGWFANAMMAMYDHTIAINKQIDLTWVGFTAAELEKIIPMLVQSLINHDEKTMAMLLRAILLDVEEQLKEKNGYGSEVYGPPTDFIGPSVVEAISNREWVGLTDEQIHNYSLDLWPSESTFENGVKWAETKLKEKNT